VETCSFYKIMCNHLKNQSKSQTKTRNNKEALSERGLWLDIDKLVEGTEQEYESCMLLTEKTSMSFFPVATLQVTPGDWRESTQLHRRKLYSNSRRHAALSFHLPHAIATAELEYSGGLQADESERTNAVLAHV
jgi:hypothetical protein